MEVVETGQMRLTGLAGQLIKGGGFGLFGNIGVGVVGALIGGFFGHCAFDPLPEVEPPPPPPAAPPPPAPVVKKKIVLRGVNFDYDKATLQAEGRPTLDEAAFRQLLDAG
jgi:hypothetical protein